MYPTATALPRTQLSDAFSFDKSVQGDVTILNLRGTLSEAFDGKKIAAAITTKRAVISMRGVRRLASWGMSDWMDFLRLRADCDIYLAECSTYAVSQLNLVTGLLGHAKLVSFYASYRCSVCNAELEHLFVIPRDGEQILELPMIPRACASCGGTARLEEYPAAFFETIAARPSFDIDDDVLAALNQKFKYDILPDLSRLRAYRAVDGDNVYLRLSGDVSNIPPTVAERISGTTVIDVRGAQTDGGVEWQQFLQSALARANVQLDGCPDGFLESGTTTAQLHGKLKIRSFDARYDCPTCEKTVSAPVDVAEHLEHLVEGKLPPAHCPTCKHPVIPAPQPELVARMRALPARDRNPALEKFVAHARALPISKLENCLAPLAPAKAKPAGTRRMGPYIVAGTALVASGVGLAIMLSRSETRAASSASNAQIAVPAETVDAKPTFVRPDWIISETPVSAYCHDLINRLMCVGVSSYRKSQEVAAAEANDAALEELVNTIGIKIADPEFREKVVPAYNAARSQLVSALQAADLERATAAYEATLKSIGEARGRVVRILQASGGPAVPPQRSDWYWEEYAASDGGTNDVLAFVRYDVSLDAVRSLMESYTRSGALLGGTVRTGFPSIAWNDPEFKGGVIVTKPGRRLKEAKIAVGDTIVAVGDQPVTDIDLAVRLVDETTQAKQPVTLSVRSPGAPVRSVQLR